MHVFEWIIALLVGSVALTGAARYLKLPYPSLLALGGVGLAFLPVSPDFSLDPRLVLALFVAPVLLDAAFDTSLRDLKRFWVPVTSLVVIAVGVTTLAVAWVVRKFVPDMPWAAAIALGAIVAPPDAAAASAILRNLQIPHRMIVILEGESLLNDATALLIYRIAVSVAMGSMALTPTVAGLQALAVIGSVPAGILLSMFASRIMRYVTDVPSAIILQFSTAFAVWIIADEIGLSAIVTVVAFAITAARSGATSTPPQLRLPSYAVWETSVFVLNVLAFVLIGLQVRPILEGLDPGEGTRYLQIAAAVLGVCVAVRIAWVLLYNRVVNLKARWFGRGVWPGEYVPTLGGSTVVSWCGMRGIVTLATSYALPMDFPHRDLALVCAFTVVVGTLIVQGLTLRPLIRLIDLKHDGTVENEIHLAKDALAMVAAEVLDGDGSEIANVLRAEFVTSVETEEDGTLSERKQRNRLRARIFAAQRRALVRLRDTQQIGDDAFHRIEERLDWAEVNVRPVTPDQATGSNPA